MTLCSNYFIWRIPNPSAHFKHLRQCSEVCTQGKMPHSDLSPLLQLRPCTHLPLKCILGDHKRKALPTAPPSCIDNTLRFNYPGNVVEIRVHIQNLASTLSLSLCIDMFANCFSNILVSWWVLLGSLIQNANNFLSVFKSFRWTVGRPVCKHKCKRRFSRSKEFLSEHLWFRK